MPGLTRVRGSHGNVALTLPRIYPRRLALAVVFLMTARAFYFIPLMSMPSEGWNVLCFLFLCFVYAGWKAKTGERILGFEFYILLVMAAMPVWAGIMADREFGQPLLYGILTQRTMILGVGALALITLFRLGWVDTEDMSQAMLILAWLTLFVYLLWTVTAGSSESLSAGPQVKLNLTFICIGFLYYGLRGFRRKSKKDYFIAAIFLATLIFLGERALLLSVVGAYGLFVLLRGSFSRLIVFIPSALIGLVALLSVLYIVDAQYITQLGGKFIDAFTVVTTGQTTTNASANARIEETAVAMPYIRESWMFGNGDVSNQWRGGYQGVLGGYFYPSDIGIFGIVYMYGVLGLAIFGFQFWYIRKYAQAAAQGARSPPMVDAVLSFLIAYAVVSTTTGWFTFNWPIGVSLIAFLYCVGQERTGRRGPVRIRRRYDFTELKGFQDRS